MRLLLPPRLRDPAAMPAASFSLSARRYDTDEAVRLAIADGRIESVSAADAIPLARHLPTREMGFRKTSAGWHRAWSIFKSTGMAARSSARSIYARARGRDRARGNSRSA